MLFTYATNERAGVLNAWWGEGDTADESRVARGHGQRDRGEAVLRTPACLRHCATAPLRHCGAVAPWRRAADLHHVDVVGAPWVLGCFRRWTDSRLPRWIHGPGMIP